MPHFRKKPVVIEAIQWTGENLKEILEFTGKHPSFDKWFSCFDDYENHVKNDGFIFKIFTLEGVMNATQYDYIIKGVNGEFYPCKPDIFNKTYDMTEKDQEIEQSMLDNFARKISGEVSLEFAEELSEILYGLDDDEILSWSDPEDRARDFIDSNWTENSPGDLPEYIEVFQCRPMTITENHSAFERALNSICECIEEDFGNPDNFGGLEFEDKSEVMAAFDAFKSKFIKNYKVFVHEPFGEPIRVYLAPLIDKD